MSIDASTPSTFTPSVKPGLSIQSILLIMLLSVSILSSVVIGAIGFVNGRESLRDAAFASLSEVRDSRAREVRGLFDTIEDSLLVESRGQSVTGATTAFASAFSDLADTELTGDESEALDAYYSGTFAAQLADATGKSVDVSSFAPDGAAQRYLALHYTAGSGDADESTWAEANDTYNDYFTHLTEKLGYEDALLVDENGTIVYSQRKGIDLGSNLLTGPFRFSNLATAYSSALATNVVDDVVFTDFASYVPALGQPTAWAVAPVAIDGRIVGALAVALPTDAINNVMTTGNDWSSSALGTTGETYLVGAGDQLMRSQSRELVEHPKAYKKEAIASGLAPDAAAAAVASGSSLLVQPVRTEAAEAAIGNDTGTLIADGYLGGETLAAYAPLGLDGLDWVIVAEIDTSEAFAPVDNFTKSLAISSAVIIFIVALLSIILAQLIVRPLKRLKLAARRIAAGEVGVQVDAGNSDEFAELGAAFNDMSTSLQVKATLLEAQQQENDKLLGFLMPEKIGKLYREGVQTISEEHQEVTVIYADIVGFEDYSASLTAEKALEALNDLYRRFDEAAEQHGVERVRTTRQGYLASCGLSVPRVDHARRTIDFAVEMQQILSRFGAHSGATLNLRAGVDSGAVSNGLVGRSHISYDLWGDAVNLAFNLQRGTNEPGIFLTERVRERLADSRQLIDSGTIDTASGEQHIWRIDEDAELG